MDFASFDSQEIPGGGWVVTTYTVYVSPYLVYNGNGYSMDADPDRFTKHYYAGSERIASRLNRIGQSAGDYNPVNIYIPTAAYEPVLVNLQAALTDFGLNDQLDAAPAPHPENPILEIPDCDSQFGYDALEIERCKCIHFWEEAIGQSINCPDYEPIYWYHPDYLGHTDFVTDRTGQPYQHFFYAPFGEALLSQHTGTGYYNTPYRFNAKELDSETGFVYYGARYYEPKESVWLSVDPKLHAFPHVSPYNFMLNNTIMMVDPGGDSAWAINNLWNDDYIQKFNAYVSEKSRNIKSSEQSYTCEDFVISIAMEFARDNGLPFKISNQSGVFSASSEKYTDFESFREDVLKHTGARDLQNEMNTILIGTLEAEAGDILLNRNSSNTATHAQQISFKNSFDVLGLHQGNSGILNAIPGTSKLLDAGNPNSIFYTGSQVEIGVYVPQLDFFKNYSTGRTIQNYSIEKNIEFRRWNFCEMNN